ncbi:MAG: 4,5-DOPA dioxygenase extradiol [bacterium]|nr:4,5-DOPA dioxygenase extradiol [bacterium]
MQRKQFIKIIAGTTSMITLGSFNKITDLLEKQDETMPVLFIGHGSPMNGIEDNEFSRRWALMGQEISVPKAVLCISAHWLTKGTLITAMEHPKTIHDFGGFPQELFNVQYPAPGNPSLASEISGIVKKANIGLDHEWGLDHGTWSVIKNMYPLANIPILQMSIDYNQSMQYHYDLAKELVSLRKKGVLIVGSGNMIHNLQMVAWDKMEVPNYGYDWAIEMHATFKKLIEDKNHQALIEYSKLGRAAILSIPTPDHYIPLLYSLALQTDNDEISFFNDKLVAGSLNMTSVKISKIGSHPITKPSHISTDSTVTDSI